MSTLMLLQGCHLVGEGVTQWGPGEVRLMWLLADTLPPVPPGIIATSRFQNPVYRLHFMLASKCSCHGTCSMRQTQGTQACQLYASYMEAFNRLAVSRSRHRGDTMREAVLMTLIASSVFF